MLFVMSVIVAISATSLSLWIIRIAMTLVPIAFMFIEKRYSAAVKFIVFYGIALYLALFFLSTQMTGILPSFLNGYASFVSQFMPAMIMAWYLIHTTKIDEFISSMQKMHIPDGVTISLAVVMRFLPTLKEEYGSIRDAMKMRGIMLGGGNVARMVEYRMVPLLFSCVNIGDELSAAAITRGLGGDQRRSSIVEPKLRAVDYVFFSVFTVAWVAFIILKYA